MPSALRRKFLLSILGTAALCLTAGAALEAAAAEKELKIGYMKNPIHEASVAIMEKWAAKNDVKLTKIPMAYSVFQEKVTATLTSGGDQFDIIWHNDDWGQLWKKWVEPTDDIPGMDKIDRWPVDGAFTNDDGRITVVPMAHTVGTFFYRADLLKPEEVPTTLDELVEVSKRLQAEGKVKWGYVGGMSMNNTWFALWWAMWNNNCDIFEPIFSRDNTELAKAGWKPAVTQDCHREVVEYWWDAIHKHKISPAGMTTYGRDEANAIFMAGDAAFTVTDSTHFGQLNDPKRSKASGKVGMAPMPHGWRRDKPFSWNEIWGWAIPKGVPAERKALAKEALTAMLLDEDGQVEMWKATGGPPPNRELWSKIAQMDPVFNQLKHAVFDQEHSTHAAYYFPQWPAVHKAYSTMAIKALSGAREDIPKVLESGVEPIHNAATQ